MKTIGTIQNGDGFLVEMTLHEHFLFQELIKAMHGQSMRLDFPPSRFTIDDDLSTAFECVKAFAPAQFKVNELRQMVDDLENMIRTNDT